MSIIVCIAVSTLVIPIVIHLCGQGSGNRDMAGAGLTLIILWFCAVLMFQWGAWWQRLDFTQKTQIESTP